MQSRLDQSVRFRLDRPLTKPEKDAIGGIPGVVPWYGNTVSAPYNVHEVVGSILSRWGNPGRVDQPPKLITPVSIDALREHCILNTEAHNWLWEADTARVPSSGFALLGFQVETIMFGAARGSANYWLPAGSGKTICAIVTALIQPGATLIVTQANARETQRREVVRCTTCRPFVITPVSGRRKGDEWASLDGYMKAAAYEGFRPVVIIGWEQLSAYVNRLLTIPWRTVVWDEAHKAKAAKREKWLVKENGGLKAVKLVNTVSAAYDLACHIPRRFSTTATPIRNRLIDLWMQLSIVEPNGWGRTSSKFAFRYCAAVPSEYGGLNMTGTSNVPELKHRIAASTIIVPHSVTHAQLPPKRRVVYRIAPEQQMNALGRTRAEGKREKEAGKKGSMERKLLDAASAKRGGIIDLCLEHMRSGHGKVIVFSGRHRDCDHLGKQLKKRAKTTIWVADGRNSIEERRTIQDEFMTHPGPCILVGTRQAWGQSLNLQDADALIWAMLPDTPGEVDQGEGRVGRHGQKRPVLVIYAVASDTYDENVAERIISKLPAVDAIVGGGSVKGLADTLTGLDRKEEILANLASIFDTDNEWGIA